MQTSIREILNVHSRIVVNLVYCTWSKKRKETQNRKINEQRKQSMKAVRWAELQ